MATKIQPNLTTNKKSAKKVNEKYSPEIIAALYEQLHQWEGAITEVAKRTNYHRETVRLTLKGQRRKSLPVVMETAVEVLNEFNQRHKKSMSNLASALAEASK